MTFAESLKKEIARITRKELRDEIAALRKSSQSYRSELAVLKKQSKAMQSQVNKLGRLLSSNASAKLSSKVSSLSADGNVKAKPGRKVVFTADRLKTQRAKLGFTQEQMGKLLEVSALSIWKWESGCRRSFAGCLLASVRHLPSWLPRLIEWATTSTIGRSSFR